MPLHRWTLRALLSVKEARQKNNTAWVHLPEASNSQIRRRAGVVRAQGGENWQLLFNRCRVSVWEDKECSGDGWPWQLQNNVNVLNAIELYI
jgi:hypothetical protein